MFIESDLLSTFFSSISLRKTQRADLRRGRTCTWFKARRKDQKEGKEQRGSWANVIS